MATFLLLTGIAVSAATSVRADHVADLIGIDGAICRLGGIASGIGVDLTTTDITSRVIKDGLTMKFVCKFSDVPEHVSAEESVFGGEWFRPSKAYVDDVNCWRPEFYGREQGRGHLVITPSGSATVTCKFGEALPFPT